MNEKEILELWDTTRRTPQDPKRVLDLWDTTRTNNYQFQQMRNRQRIQKLALIPLASGVASIVLGIGLVGSAYAEEINLDPILNAKPEVLNQPAIPVDNVDNTVPKHDNNDTSSPKEPKIGFDLKDDGPQNIKPIHHQNHHLDDQTGSAEPNIKIDPQPDSQDQPDASQPAQPQKQPLPPVAPAPPEPNTNLSPAQTDPKSVQQQPNLPKTDKDEKTNSPQKVVNSEPKTVAVGTDSEPHTLVTTGPTQTKDTSVVQLAASENQVVEPVQKTKDGVSLPKTATPYGNLFLAGFSFLLGGWLLQISRKMRIYA
ncbi:hypothetical protein [Thermoactinomyces sp. CICC 10521]|uniref:hypothetical protein n=1 Tax=Thermoactinomyces sp. CICC 10521 TaxID=2767426 RepID=UPI0018DE56C6|nr:hypothetical protein [Thermoactinomyces sp. CICC 10521]MBH8608730.1 hypothetical protein [Thermoactinomyces sp. CICC 10521]